MFEQREGLQSKGFNQTGCMLPLGRRTMWQREGVKKQENAQNTTDHKLILITLKAKDINKPHGTDKANGSECTYWWEVLDGIHPRLRQGIVGYRIGQCQGRHVKSHTE